MTKRIVLTIEYEVDYRDEKDLPEIERVISEEVPQDFLAAGQFHIKAREPFIDRTVSS